MEQSDCRIDSYFTKPQNYSKIINLTQYQMDKLLRIVVTSRALPKKGLDVTLEFIYK